jgi:ATP-dependent HslUV protease ATP-binding subunit HslU
VEIDRPAPPAGAELTPREVVAALDKFIIGQDKAKRAVAVALRNRWRRKQVAPDLRDEISPKNIILIGPTGVGKTEIARRLAKLARAPFLKVEATKFTEVGYVGKDAESMVRDLVEISIQLVREEMQQDVRERARDAAEERILRALYPDPTGPEADTDRAERTREKLAKMLRNGHLDERVIEIDVRKAASELPGIQFLGANGAGDQGGANLQDLLGNLLPDRRSKRKTTVKEARELLVDEEAGNLIDQEKLVAEAIRRAEQDGVVFIDEVDKIASGHGQSGRGPEVSREGVQRDILPIVEGTTSRTRHGQVKTDHMLFVAAGAFHVASVSDLIPELQGRFPIRVELNSLTESDLRRILTEPDNSLTRQYTALMETEGVALQFTEDGIARLAAVATQANDRSENIGARRLHTVLETLLEELSFDADARAGSTHVVDEAEVDRRLGPVLDDEDLSRYIL